MRCHEFASDLQIRGIESPLRLADYKLVAFDMDSTLIIIECVDEIAEIADVATRGEIADYKDSLRRRVALLVSVPESALQKEHRSQPIDYPIQTADSPFKRFLVNAIVVWTDEDTICAFESTT